MSADIKELIFSRRTVHNYKSEPIPEDVLREALACGLEAPNHHLTFPWRFTVVGRNARLKIFEIAKELKIQKKGEPLSRVESLALEKNFNNPGAIVAIGCLKNEDSFRAREDYATVSCAIQNISLYLWARGFGSKWGTGQLTRHPQTYEVLGLDSEHQEIIGFLYAGKPERNPDRPKRPELDTVCSWVD